MICCAIYISVDRDRDDPVKAYEPKNCPPGWIVCEYASHLLESFVGVVLKALANGRAVEMRYIFIDGRGKDVDAIVASLPSKFGFSA